MTYISHTAQEPHHIIDKILVDFGFYMEPQLLKAEFHHLLDFKSGNIQGIRKYRDLLSNIRYSWQKTLKYDKYFEVFYAPENVGNIEALNHHIHAYLQDMDTLKNKIDVFLDILKKDLKKVVSNRDEVITFFKRIKEKTDKTFEGVLKYRRSHVHHGKRFMDGDLLKAENAHGSLEMFSSPTIDAMLNQEYKPKLLAKLEKEEQEFFEIAKIHWIDMAKNNNNQTSGYLKMILEAVHPSLYRFLNIKSVNEVINTTQSIRL